MSEDYEDDVDAVLEDYSNNDPNIQRENKFQEDNIREDQKNRNTTKIGQTHYYNLQKPPFR